MRYLRKILEEDEEVIYVARHYLLAAFLGFFDDYKYVGSRYVITGKRIIIKRGVIFKDFESIALKRVERVVSRQKWYRWLFDIGEIEIFGIGGSHFCFQRIRKPLAFYKSFERVS